MSFRLIAQAEPIPGYRLIERLGRGGFGEVWKAEAPGGLHKAIKFVYGDLEEVSEKKDASAQELKALNRVKSVRHPFMLSMERVDIIEGQLVIVMELADCSLMDRFKECINEGLPGIPRHELLGYMQEAAEALDMMNSEYQLQHLDIKPQNLFLVHKHVKVADFGLVKDLEGMKASITGGITPLYASPETFEGWASRYCDQYSLAIVYQELLTGQRPFPGTNASQLVLQHVTKEPDVSMLPVGDQPVIRRALAKKPSDRFSTCMHMVQMLRSATVEPEELPGAFDEDDAPVARAQPTAKPGSRDEDTHRLGPSRTRGPIGDESAAKTDQSLRPSDTDRSNLKATAPVEFKGTGILFPALVIGIGQTGLNVVQQVRGALHDRFGTVDLLPNIRLLAIDTDPDAITAAARGAKGLGLTSRELLLARLNRPGHFLKPRDGTVPFQTWLDLNLLYRIPRSQLTASLRFLGRLAFMDHYRDIAERLRTELKACCEAETLAQADKNTKLGLRTNMPRVYIVTSMAGGTAGMFLDLAYLCRAFLKEAGYAHPDLTGVFFLPSPRGHPSRPFAVANTFAALSEIYHFSRPDTTFTARYAVKEPPIADPAPPFGRLLLMPLDMDEKKLRDTTGMGAGMLYRDLVTPMGHALETNRNDAIKARQTTAAAGPVLQVFGMNRLSWPRTPLVRQVTRQLCLRITQHWVAKDPKNPSEVVKWATDQWSHRNMEAGHMIEVLRSACEKALSAPPEQLFAEVVDKFARFVPEAANPEPAQVQQVLAELEKYVGRPETDKPQPRPPQLKEVLEKASEGLLSSSEQKLSEMAVHLVEKPQFRIAGAEEAIRQFNLILDKTIQHQEPLYKDLNEKAGAAYSRIPALLDAVRQAMLARRKPPNVTKEVVQALRLYPVLRLQGLMVQRLLTVLRSLRGNCPEYQREFTHCRNRLLDLVKLFHNPIAMQTGVYLGICRELLPPGCQTLEDAVKKYTDELSATQLLELDQRIQQKVLRRQFTALVQVATTPANIFLEVEKAMQDELEGHVAEQLGSANVVDAFLAQCPKEDAAKAEILSTSEKAAPKLPIMPTAPLTELTMVVVPTEERAENFRQFVRQAMPWAEMVPGASGDDIVFYRERLGLALIDLPHTGSQALEAYQAMQQMEHMTPHCRTDITDWNLPPAH